MKKRILVVDDDTALLDILQLLIEREGFEAFTIDQTNDLFNLITLHSPDLILLDIGLKGPNGDAWCVKIKSEPRFAAIPVIIFSAYSDKRFVKGYCGCDNFIEKPFNVDELVTNLKLFTAQRKLIQLS